MSASGLRPDPRTAEALLARQTALQSRAGEILADLDLVHLLAPIGRVVPVGSAVTRLMTWRDIDIEILCDVRSLDPQHVHSALSPLASHANVKRLNFQKHSGSFRTPGLPDGLSFTISYHEGANTDGERWNVDGWFLPSIVAEIDLADRLRRELSDETRLAILWIKDTWHNDPAYRYTVRSVDIYSAVLDHGVRNPGQFEAWLQTGGKL